MRKIKRTYFSSTLDATATNQMRHLKKKVGCQTLRTKYYLYLGTSVVEDCFITKIKKQKSFSCNLGSFLNMLCMTKVLHMRAIWEDRVLASPIIHARTSNILKQWKRLASQLLFSWTSWRWGIHHTRVDPWRFQGECQEVCSWFAMQ